MDKCAVQRAVSLATSESVFRKTGRIFVPVASSARHIHLCRADVEALFGAGYQLKHFRNLSQPGQFACQEQLTVVGPKGELKKVRVLGPERKSTQVEIALTDSFALGIRPPVRMSGKTAGTLRSEGDRATVFENVVVRAGDGHDMEVHIDTDEANAIAMSGTTMMEVLK